MKAKELKDMINSLDDDDVICVGKPNDKQGNYDEEIISVETRQCGFHGNNIYKVLTTKSYETNGALKFWR